jgi:hypothetical protein
VCAPRSIANQNVAHRVPNGVSYPAYRISCAAIPSPGGTPPPSESGSISYCTDVTGASCPIVANFGGPTVCLPNNITQFGSSSLQVRCPPIGSTAEILIPEVQTLAPTDVEINYFGQPGCGASLPLDRTIVIVPSGICHRVPNAPTLGRGYRAVCESAGQGYIQFCSEPDCSRCELSASFRNEICNPNDVVQYGSASYAVRCPANPVTLVPLPGLPARPSEEATLLAPEVTLLPTLTPVIVVQPVVASPVTPPRSVGGAPAATAVVTAEPSSGVGPVGLLAAGVCAALAAAVAVL